MENIQKIKDNSHYRLTFKKVERLCSKKVIESLFTNGDSFYVYPLKFVFLNTQLPFKVPLQAGFSVSKRTFKKAVQRNFLKRRMREAYRLNRHDLHNVLKFSNLQLAVFVVYSAKETNDYQVIEKAMVKGLAKLCTIQKATS
ncbi:MAG: ribonuclease P protein component [Draconibacterium sp.]|nr:MAG: ribonuclease P protein component [Draconibacterium sp.]